MSGWKHKCPRYNLKVNSEAFLGGRGHVSNKNLQYCRPAVKDTITPLRFHKTFLSCYKSWSQRALPAFLFYSLEKHIRPSVVRNDKTNHHWHRLISFLDVWKINNKFQHSISLVSLVFNFWDSISNNVFHHIGEIVVMFNYWMCRLQPTKRSMFLLKLNHYV